MAFARRGSKDRKPKRPAQSALFKRKKFCRFTAEKVEWMQQNAGLHSPQRTQSQRSGEIAVGGCRRRAGENALTSPC